MAGCNKEIEVVVPTLYSAKMVTMRCGNTGITGYPEFCDECAQRYADVDWKAEARANGENWDEDDY